MSGQDFEQLLGRLFSQDLSAGTEAFRDSLLDRCLSVLNEEEGTELNDDDLELLAAAGDPALLFGAHEKAEKRIL